jgi:hypothetical protein
MNAGGSLDRFYQHRGDGVQSIQREAGQATLVAALSCIYVTIAGPAYTCLVATQALKRDVGPEGSVLPIQPIIHTIGHDKRWREGRSDLTLPQQAGPRVLDPPGSRLQIRDDLLSAPHYGVGQLQVAGRLGSGAGDAVLRTWRGCPDAVKVARDELSEVPIEDVCVDVSIRSRVRV